MSTSERKAHAAAITSSNCTDMLGVSWRWVRSFATRNSVPVWEIGGRRLIPAHALLAAMRRVDAERAPVTLADDIAAEERALTEALRGRRDSTH